MDEFRTARDFLLNADYESAYRDFRWPRPDRFNWALDWFDAVLATETPDAVALKIVADDGSAEEYSFAQLSVRSSRVANWMHTQGVRRGDRILVMLGNQTELWETVLAAMKLGAVIIPATTLLTPADLADRIDRGKVAHVIADVADRSKFTGLTGEFTRMSVGGDAYGWLGYDDALDFPDQLSPRILADHRETARADDTLLLYFTSGTTSQPKLVEHTYPSYPIGHLSTMFWIGLRPGDVHLNVSSPGWAKHAWSSVFAPWNAGATILVHDYARFSAPTLLDVMRDHSVTTFCAPPTVWRMMIQEDLARWSLPLRTAVAAGEPLNPEVIDQVAKAWGITVRDGYGQTETTAQIGNPLGCALKPGSMGRPLPGYTVTLVDPLTGETGDDGEICLPLADRPLGLMAGYRDDPARTAEAMANGYYHTGDVASRDADGYITYVGRTDDVFKASDYRISPFELESVLLEHEAVAEAAVVPAPDPLRLAVPKAYVSLTPGFAADAETARAILAHARHGLAPYKRVRRIEFAELPKTISGKIRRVLLREQEQEQADQPRTAEFREEDFPDLT
ncbi:MAG TPA: AMP-binding protein [Streptomyces sp.]